MVDLLAALQKSVAAAKTSRGESPGDDADEALEPRGTGKETAAKKAPAKKTAKKTPAKKAAKKTRCEEDSEEDPGQEDSEEGQLTPSGRPDPSRAPCRGQLSASCFAAPS